MDISDIQALNKQLEEKLEQMEEKIERQAKLKSSEADLQERLKDYPFKCWRLYLSISEDNWASYDSHKINFYAKGLDAWALEYATCDGLIFIKHEGLNEIFNELSFDGEWVFIAEMSDAGAPPLIVSPNTSRAFVIGLLT